ncbi:MAG: response regulator [Nitrospirota bacterium]|nr:response regulator [Nitrospirota bacterium]
MFLKFHAPNHPANFSHKETAISRPTGLPAILIVDDDPDILTALYDLLEHDGFRVTGVSTCRDALVLVKTADFAAVVLDIGLPDGDGLAVLETIRVIAPSLPVIILTAVTTQDCRARSWSSGAFSYLTKPYDRDELRAVLRQAVR